MHRQSAGQTQQARQGPVKVDRKARFAIAIIFGGDGHQLDLLDQCSQRLLRLVHPLGVEEARDQLADPGAVGLRHAGMDTDRVRGRGGRELALQILAARVQLDHPVLHLVCRHPGQDGIDQLFVLGADAGEFLLKIGAASAAGGLQSVALGGIFLAEDAHRLFVHQVMFQRVKHPGLEVGLFDHGHVVTSRRALLAGGGAAEAIF
nr:hypothetical protein [Gemmobacter sp. LW-1]